MKSLHHVKVAGPSLWHEFWGWMSFGDSNSSGVTIEDCEEDNIIPYVQEFPVKKPYVPFEKCFHIEIKRKTKC